MTAAAIRAAGMTRLGWTAAIVLGASLPHWQNLPPWMPVLLMLSMAWRFAARLLGWPLPGRRTMWILMIAVSCGVLLEFKTINGIVPGTALLFAMVSLKFLEARSQRDHIMLTVIAYFLVFASLLLSSGLLKGVYLFAFVWVTTLGLVQVGRQGALLPTAPAAKVAGKLLLQSLPLMIVLFLLFPRLSGPLWSLPGDNTSAVSGLSESMSPGDITSLGLSDAIAFRVEFDGRVPPASTLYWRGPVLTRFDGRRWTRSRGQDQPDPDGNGIRYLDGVSRYRVSLDPDSRAWALALEMPESWEMDGRPGALRMGSDYQLGFARADTGSARLNYTVRSYSRYQTTVALTGAERITYTDLPANRNPRTRDLVNSLLTDAPDTGQIVERILNVFREAEFFYTLTPPALGRDTADDFIFTTREGFCEHYASAFTIMLRMAGVPARVVTGYQGAELNSIGGYYIVRQSNAHAWTEIWTPGDGWVRIDPLSVVAPGRIDFGSGSLGVVGSTSIAQRIGRIGLLRRAALAWDSVNTLWNDWVVGYGPTLQRNLLEWLGFRQPGWRTLVLMIVAGTTLIMLALAVLLGRRLQRRKPRDAAATAFAVFSRELRRYRVEPMRPGESPSAYAGRAAASLPAAADVIATITRTYLAARYEPDADGVALAELRERVQQFSPDCARALQSA